MNSDLDENDLYSVKSKVDINLRGMASNVSTSDFLSRRISLSIMKLEILGARTSARFSVHKSIFVRVNLPARNCTIFLCLYPPPISGPIREAHPTGGTAEMRREIFNPVPPFHHSPPLVPPPSWLPTCLVWTKLRTSGVCIIKCATPTSRYPDFMGNP